MCDKVKKIFVNTLHTVVVGHNTLIYLSSCIKVNNHHEIANIYYKKICYCNYIIQVPFHY